MTSQVCVREVEVVEAVLGRRWPEGCDDELRQHASACPVCADVLTVTVALRDDFNSTRDELQQRGYPLPSAGQIWWRAAVQARADATRAAARPLVWGYGIAAACVAGLLGTGAAFLWPSAQSGLEQMEILAARITPRADRAADALMATVQAQLPLILVGAACLLAAPIAVYLALRED
jgi:hypothetical protein